MEFRQRSAAGAAAWRDLLREWLLTGTTPIGLHRVPPHLRDHLKHRLQRLARAELVKLEQEAEPFRRQLCDGRSFALSASARLDLREMVRRAPSRARLRGVREELGRIDRCCAVLAALPEVGARRPELTGEEIQWWTCGARILLYRSPQAEGKENCSVEILRILHSEDLLDGLLPSQPQHQEPTPAAASPADRPTAALQQPASQAALANR